jgi:hypothetical protein
MSVTPATARLRPPAGSRATAGGRVLCRAAHALCLAASPVFMLMALVGHLSSGPSVMSCAMPGLSPPGGMTMMYALMGVFHLMPWLTLASTKMASSPKETRGRA